MITSSQKRLLDSVRAYGPQAEYWPVANDWVKDKGPAKSLALRNITRTINALIRDGYLRLDGDGYLSLTEKGERS